MTSAAVASADGCHLTFNAAIYTLQSLLWRPGVYICLGACVCMWICLKAFVCVCVWIMHVTALPGLMPPPVCPPLGPPAPSGALGGERREDSSFVWTTYPHRQPPPTLCTPRPPHPPQGPVAATALLGRRARRLAPTSLLLSNSQSAKPGDLSANCVGETG